MTYVTFVDRITSSRMTPTFDLDDGDDSLLVVQLSQGGEPWNSAWIRAIGPAQGLKPARAQQPGGSRWMNTHPAPRPGWSVQYLVAPTSARALNCAIVRCSIWQRGQLWAARNPS